MTALEFQPFPKIARLNRYITITEKLDGTNAAVVIVPTFSSQIAADIYLTNTGKAPLLVSDTERALAEGDITAIVWDDANQLSGWTLFAQSRTRFITPKQDNYGFADWVQRNAEALVATLGEGTHFGEWWGAGIQRKYGLTGGDKRFSLFNTSRWVHPIVPDDFEKVPGLGVVPVLYEGPFSQDAIDDALQNLRDYGSAAEEDFDRPEGIVIFHHASREMYKITLEGDDPTKQERARKHAYDEEKEAA